MAPQDEFATKQDHDCLERKFDAMQSAVTSIAGDVRSIREGMAAREVLEKQSQILLAEINAARAAASAEKAVGEGRMNDLKTRALYVVVMLCLLVSSPNLLALAKSAKALVP